MSVSTILNLYACGLFNDQELLEAYDDICVRLVLHNDVVEKEDEEIFERFIEKVTKVMNTKALLHSLPTTSLTDHQPSTSCLDMLVGQGLPAKNEFKHLQIIGERSKLIKKFNTIATTIDFKFKSVDRLSNPIVWLRNAFDELLEHLLTDALPTDRVGWVLRNASFPEKPVGISFRRVSQLSSSVIMTTLEKILQSNAQFFASDLLTLHMNRVTLPVGYGRQRFTGVSFEEFCRRRHGILTVDNTDTLCLARALVLAMAWKRNDSDLPVLKNKLYSACTRRAVSLCTNADVNLSNGGTLEHIQLFQDYLTDYTIVVYNNRLGQTVYYEGPRSSNRQVLNLIFEDNHYNVITSLTSAFAAVYFCELCRHRFSQKSDHKSCKYICPCCHSSPPCNKTETLIVCNNCNRDFRGQVCFSEHQKSLCRILMRCTTCLLSVWVDKSNKHKCGYKHCVNCGDQKPIRHLCFMTPTKVNTKQYKKSCIFVFYDFECRQDTLLDGSTTKYKHIPTLCVAQNVCTVCIDIEDINHTCNFCGVRQHIFKSKPVDEFLDYISKIRPGSDADKSEVVALAHNAKGYDSVFVLEKLVQQRGRWNPKIISNGTKLMSIECSGIKFIDSLNYLPLPLAKLPKTFNFPGSKGFFPHFFNTLANQDYVGPIPRMHYYGIDEMSSASRDKFISWYAGEIEKGTVFNFQNEILKYCIDDVTILRTACVEFWKRFKSSNGVDPFREACTIAGACNKVFRRNFLSKDVIGLVPPLGYRMADNQSNVALQWLMWVEHSSHTQIQHAGNGREVRLPEGHLVDGFDAASNTVYQFHGCYYHGCEDCFPDQTAMLADDKTDTMFMRREKTDAVNTRIQSFGYNLVVMKECVFKVLIKSNTEVQEFLNNHFITEDKPLNPRDSFFGGRTNAVKLYYKAENEEKVRYLDVCSLYPFVNKYGKYPVGHPKLHIGADTCCKLNVQTIEGIIKCTVLPPTNLYHPVLPTKMHNKLMFILCRTCGESLNKDVCDHNSEQRQFQGTFVADELRKAISLGYKVVQVDEVWEYETTQYNPEQKSGGLFTSYVNNFLKMKQECSGWPSWCSDDEQKDKYVTEYLKREGVKLDKSNVGVNPGLRYISKLCLNSFWGKFGQRENLMQSSIITDPAELFKKLTDPSVDVHALTTIDEECIILNWNRPEDSIQQLKTVNVVLAAYTTANARLVLYNYLEGLGDRVLYFDTDSIIFTQKPREWAPTTGDFLGDMTDEVECYGVDSYIMEYVSGGPKNYALKIFSTNANSVVYVCKVKGITLNYKNSEVVNFETLRRMVLEGAEVTYVETDRKICRTSAFDVISKPEKKQYQVTYTKRRRVEDSMDTVPYGFRF